MKKKSVKKNIYSCLNLVLLKYQGIENILNINVNLKYALKIISTFSKSNKKIWFIGFDSFINLNKLNLSSNYLFLSSDFLIKGVIGNRKYVKLKSKYHNFKKPELVVILGSNNKIDITNKEISKLNIPIITFGSIKNLSLKSCYIINIPFKNLETKTKNFCFFLIYSILKINYGKTKQNI